MSHQRRKLPVSLNGASYQVEAGAIQRRFLPSRANQVEQQDFPPRLNPLGPLRYELTDWSLGAGQETYDLPTSSPRRFFSSTFIDPFTEIGTIRLSDDLYSRTADKTLDQFPQFGPGMITAGGIYNYFHSQVSGPDASTTNGLFFSKRTTPTNISKVTGFDVGGVESDGIMAGLTYSNNYVYISISGIANADSVGIWRAKLGSTTATRLVAESAFPGATARYLFGARDRLFASWDDTGNEEVVLGEANADGTLTELFRRAYSTANIQRVTALVEAGNGLYFTHAERIYFIGIEDDATLATPVSVAVLPTGETFESGIGLTAPFAGLLVMGTSRGIRLGIINPDDTVTYGPLLDDGLLYPWHAGALGEFLHALYTDGITLKISEFTEPLVPVWAKQYGPLPDDASRTIHIVTVTSNSAGELYFFGNRDLGAGLSTDRWRAVASGGKEETGSLTTSWITFGVTESKIPRAVDLRHEPLPGASDVKVYLIQEGGTETLVGTSDTVGSTGPTSPFQITGISAGERFRLRIELNRGATTESPVVRSVSLFAHAAPSKTEEFVLPLLISETVLDENSVPVAFDPDEVYSALRTLSIDHTAVTLEFGDESHTVIVDNVEIREGNEWDDDRDGLRGLLWVTCRTVTV